MSKGALLIACNNTQVDYIKQAIFCAARIKQYLNIPVSLVTDNASYLEANYQHEFDNVIEISSENSNYKTYRDGVYKEYKLQWKNLDRHRAYELSPYNETIIMDTDYILCNDCLKYCFEQSNDVMLYKNSTELSGWRDVSEFKHISANGIDFYWATVIYFRKSKQTELFFNLVSHIKEYWYHYKNLYRITATTFRNDFAFSIAIHIMNGHMSGNFVKQLPGKKYYTVDKDICLDIKNDKVKFLLQKKDSIDYFPAIVEGCNVHIMNKFSLNRLIDEL